MRLLIVGIVLTIGVWVWLMVSVSWGESPLQYHSRNAWYHAGTNLNFVLYSIAVPIAHSVLGAGIAVVAMKRRIPTVKS